MKKIEFLIISFTYNLPHFKITFKDGGMSKAMRITDAVQVWAQQGGKIWLEYKFM